MNDMVCINLPGQLDAVQPRFRLSEVHVIFHQPRASLVQSLETTTAAAGMGAGALTAIKQLLVSNTPVIVSVPVYEGGGWDSDGHVTLPAASLLSGFLASANAGESPKKRGWHAIVLCGYEDAKSRFRFKNSWGPSWGQNGYGTITYDYISTLCDLAMYGK